jgi:uncharacterized MAPEG superfamily protein
MFGLSTEMLALAAAVLLAIVHIFAAIQAKTAQYGRDWNMGARDEDTPPLNAVAGRLERAQANYYESLPLVLALLLAIEATGRNSAMTAAGGIIWLAARIVYLPLYAAGTPRVRTFVYLFSLFGIARLLFGLLRG